MSTVNGFQVGSETLKYNYESLDNYNTPNFSTSSRTTYAVGDYVMYNGKLYKCTTATTGGTWVSSSWALAVLSDDVSDLTRQISDVESAIYPPTINWQIGTLSSSTGKPSAASNRLRTVEYIPIENFKDIEISTGNLGAFVYREVDGNKTGNTGWMAGCAGITKDGLLALDANAKYFKLMWKNASDTDVSVADVSNFTIHTKASIEPEITIEEYSYYGEKISVDNKVSYGMVGVFGSPGIQSGCIYNNTLFRFTNTGKFWMFNLLTKVNIGYCDLGGSVIPHCNTACFSHEFYSDSDEFPLLYINAYNASGLPKGTCYVHRIIKSGSNYTTELIQTITIGFTNDSEWTDGSGDSRPYGNFCIDADNHYLYVYTLKDTSNVTKFFKFALPSISNADITLSKTDILDSWECNYFPVIQDNACKNGLLYLCTGEGNSASHGFIRVVDPIRKIEISTVDLYDVALEIEPEMIDIYQNGILCGETGVYKFMF